MGILSLFATLSVGKTTVRNRQWLPYAVFRCRLRVYILRGRLPELSPPPHMAALCNSFAAPPFFVTFVLLLNLLFSDSGLIRGVSSVGINYGQVANNLPSPDDVLVLLKSLRISKIRIYDTNPEILTSFANSNIDIIVTLGNELVEQVVDPQQALDWVTTNIKRYLPSTKISGISIGNEPFNSDDSLLKLNLVPAMASIHAALVQLGLDSSIQVSSANSLAVLSNSFPPSAASFRQDLVGLITPMLQFLADTGSPFWINAYPYFAYKDNPTSVSLNYVLFQPDEGMLDPYTNLHYDNMLYAQVDAVIFAMARLGFGGVEVRVSETGWPSNGDPGEYGASLFALFNENMKPGPTSERNYGLYRPDGTKAYDVGLT